MMSTQASPQPSSGNIRPLLFVLLTVTLLFFASYIGRLRELSEVDRQLEYAKAKVELAKAQNQSLLEAAVRGNSSDQIETMARRDLTMVKSGDQPFTLIQPTVTLPEPIIAGAMVNPRPSLRNQPPIWRQWLQLFSPQ